MLRTAQTQVRSPRTPIPLLIAGLVLAALLIALVALPQRQVGPDPASLETLNQREAIALVAREIRSGPAAARAAAEGTARFEDGSWYVSVGEAQFRFSERNKIVLAENAAARALQFGESAR